MDDSVLNNLIGENNQPHTSRSDSSKSSDGAGRSTGADVESIPEEVFAILDHLYSTFIHNSHIRSRL
jgi:hypothetical protein